MGNRRNLVLGGSGTIGKPLCSYLESLGEEVVNLDIVNGFDLRSDDMMPYKDVDFVWFLAWDVGGAKYLNSPQNLFDIINNNTLICQKVFTFLKASSLPFLFTSSQLAASDNTYGVTKLLGEEWTRLLEGKIVKLWNVYGWEEPGERSHVIPDLVVSALQNGKIQLLTDGEEQRQFIYIEDCIQNLYKIRGSELKHYHLTSGQWISIFDLANVIAEKLNVPVAKGTIAGYNNKIDSNQSYHEFEFRTSLSEGVDLVIEKAESFLKTGKAI